MLGGATSSRIEVNLSMGTFFLRVALVFVDGFVRALGKGLGTATAKKVIALLKKDDGQK